MDKLDFTKALDCYGRISDGQLFIHTYAEPPVTLVCRFDDKIDFDALDCFKLKEIFPECKNVFFQKNVKYGNVKESDDEKELTDIRALARDARIDLGQAAFHDYTTREISLYFDKRFVTLSEQALTVLHASDDREIEAFVKDVLHKLPHTPAEPEPHTIEVICYANGDFYTSEEKITETHIDVDKAYNDDFKPVYDKLVEFIKSEKRCSGIALLSGIMGSGKTSMIRSLVSEIPANYIYITPAVASHLAEPEFMSFLLENKDSVFILEDCEQVIMDREDANLQSAVASLLNMSDGLMSDIFNGKFICTFNSDLTNIDKALTRPGRCVVNYKFGKLVAEKADKLYAEVHPDKEPLHKAMTLAEIYCEEIVTNATTDKKTKKIGY